MLQKIYRSLWKLAILIAILSAPVGLMRLVGMLWAGHYHKYLIPMIIIISVIGIILLIRNYTLKFDTLSIVLSFAIIFGSFIGIVNFETLSLRYFVSHFFGAIFMLVIYLFSINQSCEINWLERFIKKSSLWLTYVFSLVLLIFWGINIFFFGGNLYLGIGTGYLILPLAFFLVYSKFKSAFFIFFLILISGKRGPLLSAMVLVLAFLPFCIKKNFVKSILIAGILVCLVATLVILTQGFTNFESLPIYISSPLQKLSTLNPNADDYNEDLAFSGRNQELILASSHFLKSPLNFITGLGFGWSYFFNAVIEGSTTTDFNVHYVHIAPVNFFLTLGFPIAILILGSMFSIFIKAYYFSLVTPLPKIILVILLFWIGDFANSLSGYSFPIDPLFWISLAFLSVIFKNNFKGV